MENEATEDEGSIDEACEDEYENQVIECLTGQDDYEEADVLNADAEVEDLGKRKGTNSAREDMVKKFR